MLGDGGPWGNGDSYKVERPELPRLRRGARGPAAVVPGGPVTRFTVPRVAHCDGGVS